MLFFAIFLLILEGYNVKVDQHVLFPVGLGIYIYILSPQVSGSLTLTLNRMKTDETSLCVYGFMMIHEHGFIDLYIIIHIYIYISFSQLSTSIWFGDFPAIFDDQ